MAQTNLYIPVVYFSDYERKFTTGIEPHAQSNIINLPLGAFH
jgi:hypothetical protein